MIEEDNDPPDYAREFIGDRGQRYHLTPWPPSVELDGDYSVDCATPYVLPVLGMVLGGVVLALALGVWVVNKIRPW